MWSVFLYSFLAGVIGTGFGGLIGVLAGERGKTVITSVLSITGGIMAGIVCFELIPEAFELLESDVSSHIFTVLILVAAVTFGVALTSVLDGISHRVSHLYEKKLPSDSNREFALLGTGILIVLAVALHNFPEGMALGVVTHSTLPVIAIMLALHNVPAGMSMSLPLTAGGMRKGLALSLTALAGAVTVVGAVVGFLVGGIHPIVNACILAAASGALLYVAFCEVIPHSFRTQEGHLPSLLVIVGLLLGFAVTYLLHAH